jgi:hypothetical protein
MSFMSALAGTESGNIYMAAAVAAGVDPAEAEHGMAAMSPAIARKLKARAEADPEAFEDLLDLLEDNGDAVDAESIAGPDAISDGNAILTDIYGSRNSAITEMRQVAGDLPETALSKLAAISATAVLASLARAHTQAMPLAGTSQAMGDGGGLLSTIVSAVIKGAVEGASRQLAPKRRRRRSYSGYFGTKRKRTTRRKRRTGISIDDIFAEILGTRRR